MRGSEGGSPSLPQRNLGGTCSTERAVGHWPRPSSARPNNDNGNWTILYYSLGLKSHDGGRLEKEEERVRGLHIGRTHVNFIGPFLKYVIWFLY